VVVESGLAVPVVGVVVPVVGVVLVCAPAGAASTAEVAAPTSAMKRSLIPIMCVRTGRWKRYLRQASRRRSAFD